MAGINIVTLSPNASGFMEPTLHVRARTTDRRACVELASAYSFLADVFQVECPRTAPRYGIVMTSYITADFHDGEHHCTIRVACTISNTSRAEVLLCLTNTSAVCAKHEPWQGHIQLERGESRPLHCNLRHHSFPARQRLRVETARRMSTPASIFQCPLHQLHRAS